MATIAIVGAAGFVGMELVSFLEERGHNIIAIARNNGKFLLQKNRCTVIHPAEVTHREDIDVVINLAYPNSGSVHHYSKRNSEILDIIVRLSGTNGRVIHTSTLAVFGFLLEYPITPQSVSNRRDYLYVESKIELENMLLKNISHDRLEIVRLGNVWGKGSGGWTASLIEKLLFGIPVGIQGIDGYSNSTDVVNVISYLTFLAESKTKTSMLYHHLAEFSATNWSYWIGKISSLLNLDPVYISSSPYYPITMREEIIKIIEPLKPMVVYKKMVFGRRIGSLLHSLISVLSEERFAKIKQHNIQSASLLNKNMEGNEIFLWVMSCKKEFVSVTNSEWKPIINIERSWQRVVLWMEEIGYYEKK